MFFLSLVVNVGMWFERFVIIVTSLANDFLPESWEFFTPTWVDIGTMVGAFGLFFTLFLLFCRFLPMIAMAEVKMIMPAADPHHGDHGRHDHEHQASAPEVSRDVRPDDHSRAPSPPSRPSDRHEPTG